MRLGRVTPGRRAAVLMTVIFFNSGNFSIPLQKLAFAPWGRGDEAAGLQVVIMLVQNVAMFTFGILLASGGREHRSWRATARHVVRFPPLYALAAALATLYLRSALGDRGPEVARALSPFWAATRMASDAFMAIALVTLGAQLATVGRRQAGEPLALPVLLRLAAGPLAGLVIVLILSRWMTLDPLTAQVMRIAACAPTALNSVLLCMEFDNHPAMVARVVLWTTLIAPVVVTVAIAFARSGAVEALSLPPP
jgi:predicted permease